MRDWISCRMTNKPPGLWDRIMGHSTLRIWEVGHMLLVTETRIMNAIRSTTNDPHIHFDVGGRGVDRVFSQNSKIHDTLKEGHIDKIFVFVNSPCMGRMTTVYVFMDTNDPTNSNWKKRCFCWCREESSKWLWIWHDDRVRLLRNRCCNRRCLS